MLHVKVEDYSIGKDGGKICKETVKRGLKLVRVVRCGGCVPEWCQVLQVTQVTEEDKRKQERKQIS